jgi:hypothetical protein
MVKSLVLSGEIKLQEDSTDVLSNALSISENYTEVTVQDLQIAASGTDVAISFGGVNTDAVLVILVPTYATSGSPVGFMTCKVNAGSDNIPFGKLLVLGGKSTTAIESISVSNSDAVNAVGLKVYICK